MLADDGSDVSSGNLVKTLHLPGAWLDALIDFILLQLPLWRDDEHRRSADSETTLTAQLCGYLNSACSLAPGFDTLQFKQEEPDPGPDARRKMDLVAAPRAAVLWINGRRHDHYDTLVPIECKRLPTPSPREKREYLQTLEKSTGGVQRFKHGMHGSESELGVLIGYIQHGTIESWLTRMDWWVRAIARAKLPLWSDADRATLDTHNSSARTAAMTSVNARSRNLTPIRLRHLWLEM
jgi:hypothetical protein